MNKGFTLPAILPLILAGGALQAGPLDGSVGLQRQMDIHRAQGAIRAAGQAQLKVGGSVNSGALTERAAAARQAGVETAAEARATAEATHAEAQAHGEAAAGQLRQAAVDAEERAHPAASGSVSVQMSGSTEATGDTGSASGSLRHEGSATVDADDNGASGSLDGQTGGELGLNTKRRPEPEVEGESTAEQRPDAEADAPADA